MLGILKGLAKSDYKFKEYLILYFVALVYLVG